MILTKEFLTEVNSCAAGYRFGIENKLIGGDYDAAISFCAENGQQEFADWLREQKKTEYFVRKNGSILKMAFQVFNPLTGVHTRYETEEEAKLGLADVAREILTLHCPTVVQELSNENGDTTWIPTDLHKTITVG